MFNLRPLKYLLTASLFGLAAACGDDGGTEPDPDPVIASQSGNNQSAPAGQAVSNPLVVRMTQSGSALSGTTVTWAVTNGGGSVNPTNSTTGADGTASTTWTLGGTPGTNRVTASATGATGSPVSFTATGTGTAPGTAAVAVLDNRYDPTSVTVAAGGTVTWTWQGTNPHTVTFATGTNSAEQNTGSFSRDFPTAGTFSYQCEVHGAAMSGTVVVQ